MKKIILFFGCMSSTSFMIGQNIGINIASPNATLDVIRGTAPWGTAAFRGTSNNSLFNFGTTEDTYIRGGKPGAHVILNDIPGSGNIGIGTSTPYTRLDIAGVNGWDLVNGEGDVRLGNIIYRLKLGVALDGSGAGAAGIMQYGTPGGYNALALGSQGKNLIRLYGNNDIVELANLANGKVGIGNNNPAYILDISNRMRIRSGGDLNYTAGILFNNSNNSGIAGFMGMEDDTYIGLWGTGVGWRFGMNIQTGALKVNGSEGTAGKVLQSNGNAPAGWINPTNMVYNNMHSFSQSSSVQIPNNGSAALPGLSTTLNVPSISKVMVSFFGYGTSLSCAFCGASSVSTFVYFDIAPGSINNRVLAVSYHSIQNGQTTGLGNGFGIVTLNPGVYNVHVHTQNSGPTAQVNSGNLHLVVIPQ